MWREVRLSFVMVVCAAEAAFAGTACGPRSTGSESTPVSCQDGTDDDGDGLVDCDDPDCAASGVCSVPEECGNGLVEGVEECDAGEANGTACPETCCRLDCTLDRCGDGVLDGWEECDEGALNSNDVPDRCRVAVDLDGDGTTESQCVLPLCGDLVVDSGETCDDGQANDLTPDACREDCLPARCGDGVADTGEACDDGLLNDDTLPDHCRSDCSAPSCGDGVVDAGEACDGGVDNDDTLADRCRTSCSLPACGDGVVDSLEECEAAVVPTCMDLGSSHPGSPACPVGCVLDATPCACGDGIVDLVAGEDCEAPGPPLPTCADLGYVAAPPGGAPFCQMAAPGTAGCLLVATSCLATDRDLNGDGYDDVVTGAPSSSWGGIAGVNLGSAIGLTTPGATLVGPGAPDQFGASVALAGDLNGDSFADVVVGAPSDDATGVGAGRIYVYFGAPGLAFDTTADVLVDPPAGASAMGTAVAAAGDVNGDGYGDLIASFVLAGSPGSAVYLGGPIPIFDAIADGGPAAAGGAVAAAGDMNGDGYDDVVACAGGAGIYLGGAGSTFEPTVDVSLPGCFGVSSGSDLNGDGYADLASSTGGGMGTVSVYFGGPTLDGVPETVIAGVDVDHELGVSMDAAGDVNGDGFRDLLVGCPNTGVASPPPDYGRAYVYLGGAGGALDATADISLVIPFAGAFNRGFGRAVGGVGDVDGDGFDDFVIGALNSGLSVTGTSNVYYGPDAATSAFYDTTTMYPGDQWGFAVD